MCEGTEGGCEGTEGVCEGTEGVCVRAQGVHVRAQRVCVRVQRVRVRVQRVCVRVQRVCVREAAMFVWCSLSQLCSHTVIAAVLKRSLHRRPYGEGGRGPHPLQTTPTSRHTYIIINHIVMIGPSHSSYQSLHQLPACRVTPKGHKMQVRPAVSHQRLQDKVLYHLVLLIWPGGDQGTVKSQLLHTRH